MPEIGAILAAGMATYDAFVCYSQKDARLAREIARGLGKLDRRGVFGVRSGIRVFADIDELKPGDVLPTVIRKALDRSRYLILIVSPAAAESAWIERELEIWLRTQRPDRILIVLADGSPESSIPRVLGDLGERLWLDLRWARDIDNLPDRPEFVDAIVSLAAAIVGVDKASLRSTELRRTRRLRQITGVAVAMTLLAMLLVVYGIMRARQEQIRASAAVERARVALRQASITRAQTIAAERAFQESQARAAAARLRIAILERELANLRTERGVADAMRAVEKDNEALKTRLAESAAQFDKMSAQLSQAEQRTARAEAAAAENAYQLNQARAELRLVTSRSLPGQRLAAVIKPHVKELAATALGAFLLLTVSTRWILVLLKLEFKPVSAVAIPFYLTRVGRWRLFRGYRKNAETPEVAFDAAHYLDIPYIDSDGVPGNVSLARAIGSALHLKNVVVLAGGGRGKSTLCHRTMVAALKHEILPNGHAVIPVIVDGLIYDGNLLRTITDVLLEHDVHVNSAIVDALLGAGLLMVLFDGWSEVQALIDAGDEDADAPATIRRYPRTRFVFTSRSALPPTLHRALRDVVTVELCDIDDDTLPVFLTRYLARRVGEAQTLAKKLAAAPLSLPYTPLMLRLVAAVYEQSGEIPTQRTTLFENYLRQLFRPEIVRKIDSAAIDYLVKYLTRFTYLLNHGRRGFPLHRGVQLVREIKDVLEGFSIQLLPFDVLKLLLNAGLYRRSGDRMRCFHDSFESYFAAKVLYDEFAEGRYETISACAADITFLEAIDFLLEIAAQAGEISRLREAIDQTRNALTPTYSG